MVAANLSADSAQIGWFGLKVGGHPALSLHSSNEPGELSQWLCHDDSTINIVSNIIIIIITSDVMVFMTCVELLDREDRLVQQNDGDEHDASARSAGETDDAQLDIADFSIDDSARGMLLYIFVRAWSAHNCIWMCVEKS